MAMRSRRHGARLVLALSFAVASADAPAQDRLGPCLACHGADGQSKTSEVPSLGAMPAKYTLIQLFMFREGMRVASPMNELMKGASDDDLQAFANEIAKLPAPPPPAEAAEEARFARGQAMVEQQHCNVCHEADFSGQENVPRLKDQREDYLLKTLRAYKSAARHGYDASMAEVVRTLEDPEFADLAYFLAHAR